MLEQLVPQEGDWVLSEQTENGLTFFSIVPTPAEEERQREKQAQRLERLLREQEAVDRHMNNLNEEIQGIRKSVISEE